MLPVAVLGTLIAAAFAYAAPAGRLDRSFGRHGVAVARHIRAPAAAAAVGRHNRVVAVAGGNHGAFMITRTLPNGDTETDFGDGGVVTVRFGSDSADPTSVAIDRKGGIMVAGAVCSDFRTSCHVGLARLRPNGDLNRDFGDDGTVEISFPKPYVRDPSVAFGAGDRIVVAASNGDSYREVSWDIALAALRSDGSLDPGFGEGGKVIGSFVQARDDCKLHTGSVSGMALDSRDRIVVAGECMREQRAAVARFRRSGEVDHSFGGDGVVDRKVGIFIVEALAVDKRNRIDVFGGRGHKYAVARLRTDGRLDRSFGRGGKAKGTWEPRTPNRVAGVRSGAIDSRGRIVVAGEHVGGFAFARFKPNGRADRRFGKRGRVIVEDPKKGFGLHFTGTAAVDARDRIIGSGVERRSRNSANSHLALVRLLG
jgi:uncharacterized delta-60 repeat protein